MANGIRTSDPRGFYKGRSSKFREGSRVRQTPEEGRRTYRPKRCGNDNEDGDNSPKNLNDKNQQSSSQKFRQLILLKSFSHQRHLMVFHWSLSDSKSPQVSRTLLSILAVLNNVVVWMVSTRSPTSKSSRPFNNPLVTEQSHQSQLV